MAVQVDVCRTNGRMCIAMNCGERAEVLAERDQSPALPYCLRHAEERLSHHKSQQREIDYTDDAEQLFKQAGLAVIK